MQTNTELNAELADLLAVVTKRRPTKKTKQRTAKATKRRKSASKKSADDGPTDKPIVISDYMTTPEAAFYLRLSCQYLEGARYRADGSGPVFVKLERAVRYRKADLDEFMTKNIQPPDKPVVR